MEDVVDKEVLEDDRNDGIGNRQQNNLPPEEASGCVALRRHDQLKHVDQRLRGSHSEEHAERGHDDHRTREVEVGVDGLAIGRTFREHDGQDDVLKLRQGIDGVVLVAAIDLLRRGGVERDEPRLLLDVEEGEGLEPNHDDQVKENRHDRGHRYERGRRRRRGQVSLKRLCPPEEEGEQSDQEEVDVQELDVREVAVDRVEDHDGDELRQGVGGHVLEHAEGGDEGRSALLDEGRDARNVCLFRREGRGHRRLRLRERNADVSALEGTAVVSSVAAHTCRRTKG